MFLIWQALWAVDLPSNTWNGFGEIILYGKGRHPGWGWPRPLAVGMCGQVHFQPLLLSSELVKTSWTSSAGLSDFHQIFLKKIKYFLKN